MRRPYSRLTSTEERKNKKDAIRFVVLSIVAGVVLFFFGVPTLAKFAGFVSEIGKTDKPIGKNDSTPPAPPQIELPPEFTNQKEIEVKGKAEEGATIKARFNDEETEVVANASGEFSFTFKLQNGENTLNAKAKDASGNESFDSTTYTITFDDEKPELAIEKPSDGQSFFGDKQKQLEIIGKTEGNSRMTINDRFVSVDEDGNFKFTSNLTDGENKFNIKVWDQAGNYTEENISVNFSS